MITIHEGDNRGHLRRLIDEGVRVHSVVTDPPYGLVSITKRFGADKAAPAKFGTDGAFARQSRGFMGSKWDGSGIERDPEFWRLIWEILLPGGYVAAFSSPRTGHWQAVAMEMAGFIMHPFIGWTYGSGFPKAHNAAKAIDKKLGKKGGLIPNGEAVRRESFGAQQNATGDWAKTEDAEYQPGQYVPATDEARQWEGWAYGAQSMKPALEPIYLAQKPFSEKDGVLNLLKHGVGALNIDGCRVETTDDLNGGAYAKVGGRTESNSLHQGSGMNQPGKTTGLDFVQPKGRHPANLCHDGSDSVVALFPQSAGQQAAIKGTEPSNKTGEVYGEFAGRTPAEPRNDSGSAARFFNSFPSQFLCDVCEDSGQSVEGEPGAIYLGACAACGGESARPLDIDPLHYHSKANKSDRAGSKHPTVKPVALMEWLVKLMTPPGGTVLDPFAGSGTTGQAAFNLGFDCILMEGEAQFADDIRRRFNFPTTSGAIRTDGERLDEFEALLGNDAHDDFTMLLAG